MALGDGMRAYIITTTTPDTDPGPKGPPQVTRRAVATLDEARTAVADIVRQRYPDRHPKTLMVRAALTMRPEQGGTVGPLPDGTVIEVRPA